jgi:hypothetical protein
MTNEMPELSRRVIGQIGDRLQPSGPLNFGPVDLDLWHSTGLHFLLGFNNIRQRLARVIQVSDGAKQA